MATTFLDTTPWRFILFGSAAASVTLVQCVPELSYVGTFLRVLSIEASLWLVYSVILNPKWLTHFRKLPQPKGGSFFMGHFKAIMTEGLGDPEARWLLELPHKGLIYYNAHFNTKRVIVASPNGLHEVCTRTSDFIKPGVARNLAQRLLGLGLVLSDGEMHRQQRRAFLPAFAPKHIREMYPIFWSKAREVTDKLTGLARDHAAQEMAVDAGTWTFEVGHWASRTSLDIITMASMGKNFGAIQDADAPLSKIYRNLMRPTREYFVLAMMKWYLTPWLVDRLPIKINRDLDSALVTIRGVVRELLREKKRKLAENTLADKDLLSVCLHYEETAQCTEEEVVDQMTTFLAGGHETVAVGVTWVIYMLCLHQDWQQRVREEVRAHLPSLDDAQGREATAAVVEQMPLLQAFILETLRWYPPIPMTMREATRDTTVDGVFVPARTRIILPLKGICRSEVFWGADAKQFRPERWLTGGEDGGSPRLLSSGGVLNKYGNMIFMHGQRSCVGAGLAKAETACIVSAWVGRFELDLADESLRDERNMTITGGGLSGKPSKGLHVRVKVLEGW